MSLQILLPFFPRFRRYTSEEIIFAVSFVTVFSLVLIPREKFSENLVPVFIFNGQALFFYTFVLALNFAFCGAVVTIFLRHIYPALATCTRLLSNLSMALAIGVVASLLLVNLIA